MEEHRYDDVWKAIASERIRQRVTYDELAKRTDLPSVSLRRYFQGRIDPPYSRVVSLAEALGIDVHASVTHGQATEEKAAA